MLETTRFWEFIQNNSEGFYVLDEKAGVGVSMIIEAHSREHAWERLDDIGEDVNGFWYYCECCGPRWEYPKDEQGKDIPMRGNKPVKEAIADREVYRTYIHYLTKPMEAIMYVNTPKKQ